MDRDVKGLISPMKHSGPNMRKSPFTDSFSIISYQGSLNFGTMGDFSIQISSKLIKQLAEESEQPKRKVKRTKPKVSQRSKTDQARTHHDHHEAEKPTPKAETPPVQPAFFFPIPQQQAAAAGASVELESIRSVLKESEKVLEKLEKQEKSIADEVTERAKYLRENEFKIPEPKPMPCSSQHDALMKCFRENIDDQLKCSGLVRIFENCSRRFAKPVTSEEK
ncbi:unnamed protein product [Microthlaspi erraticum]|uniref:CHCH domain-containing protein n=1 Tax=Microthlaspi erraticum TaxID=1685480 RepID=A0A6D2HZN3_9BRAS|nr:unnamed protein product [Microthlaspi erraticum]